MEKADRLKTVDKMVECFGPEEAVKITVKILRKMNQNLLAELLENKHKQHKQGQMSSNAHTGVSVDVKAETAATVHAPVLTDNTITAPVTFNYSLNTAGHDSHQFTLDPNTVHKGLRLSERNRVITNTLLELQPYPDHPDRFDDVPQVLCSESVCGRCYWEIEWSGSVCISVSYKSISRKGMGEECGFGFNDQSWSLLCTSSSYSFWHNDIWTEVPVKPIISRRTGVCRIGVCVDYSAGTLSFYSVSDTLRLIHTVQTTFTHTLYPGFTVYDGSVKLC